MVYAYVAPRPRGRRAPARLPARQRVRTSTTGARSTSRSSACSSDEGMDDMSAPHAVGSVPRPRSSGRTWPAGGGSASSRSSRPAPTAAPRSISTRWSPGSTRPATTCRSCRCRREAPCASSSGRASPVLVIDEPDDSIAVGALAAHLAEVRADVVHAHMYRAETVAARAVIALGEAGQRRPYLVATAHSSRVRSRRTARPCSS